MEKFSFFMKEYVNFPTDVDTEQGYLHYHRHHPWFQEGGLVGRGQRQTQSHLCWVGKVVLSPQTSVSLTDKYKYFKIKSANEIVTAHC